MQKHFKIIAAASYIFAAVFLSVYFAAEMIPRLYLSTAARLLLLCGCCAFLWLGGFLLTKRTGNNKAMKINLWLFLGLYLLLFATLTLFDPMWGRNGGFVIWDKELFEDYVEFMLNPVPFKTITKYLFESDFRGFMVNIIGNLVCLMPLGILLPLISEKQRKTGIFILTCSAVVLTVELLQFATLAGSCDIDDLILNVGGAFIIYLFTKNKEAFDFLRYIFLLEKGEK